MIAKSPKAKSGSIERALGILDVFRPQDTSLSLAEIASRTGLYKSTILRVIASLTRKGYLVQLANGEYRLGPTLARLGQIYQQSFRLGDHVMPALERLAKETGESASFYVREGSDGICLFRVHSQQWIRDDIQVGTLIPIPKGASGQVLAEFQTPRAGSSPLLRMSIGALAPDSAALAVPVFGHGQQLLGALTLSGPKSRFTRSARLAMGETLLKTAEHLTFQLGGDSTCFSKASAGPRRRSSPRTASISGSKRAPTLSVA